MSSQEQDKIEDLEEENKCLKDGIDDLMEENERLREQVRVSKILLEKEVN